MNTTPIMGAIESTNMRKRASWRELLDSIIRVRADRDRIAASMGINPVTLTRWASGESTPRMQNLRYLLSAIPAEHREAFQVLLEEDQPVLLFEEGVVDNTETEIPFQLINTILTTRETSSVHHISWVIIHQVLRNALLQLDPQQLGINITFIRCMPPGSDGKVHSLREEVGLGTPPWETSFEENRFFWGAETLVGHAVTTARMQQEVNVLTQPFSFSHYRTKHEVSAVACPILFHCRVAGCLLFTSTQADYFQGGRSTLVQGYTSLLALALSENEFYAHDLIQLEALPPPDTQREQIMSFRSRVIKLLEGADTEHYVSNAQAEQMAWQQIEAVLLRLPFHFD
jgi:hypothetical protein